MYYNQLDADKHDVDNPFFAQNRSSFEAFNDYHPDQRCMSYRDPQEAMVRMDSILKAFGSADVC